MSVRVYFITDRQTGFVLIGSTMRETLQEQGWPGAVSCYHIHRDGPMRAARNESESGRWRRGNRTNSPGPVVGMVGGVHFPGGFQIK